MMYPYQIQNQQKKSACPDLTTKMQMYESSRHYFPLISTIPIEMFADHSYLEEPQDTDIKEQS